MKKKLNKSAYNQKESMHILQKLPDNLVSFSFRFLDFTDKFPLKKNDDGYFKIFFDRVRSISQTTIDEFKTNKSDSLRVHTHDWNDTSEPDGFKHLNQHLRQSQPWQFQLSLNQGRVHGILIDDVFYIIWLDPEHNLYN